MITANLHTFAVRNVRFGSDKKVIYPNYHGSRPNDTNTSEDIIAIKSLIMAKRLEQSGDYARAIIELDKAYGAYDSEDIIHKSVACYNKAKDYFKLGDKSNALLCFYEAINLFKNIVSNYDYAKDHFRVPEHKSITPHERYIVQLADCEKAVGNLLRRNEIPKEIKKKIHKWNDPIYYYNKAYNHLYEVREQVETMEKRNSLVKEAIVCCHRSHVKPKIIDKWAKRFNKN